MRAYINEVEVRFSEDEKEVLRKAHEKTVEPVECPTEGHATISQVRYLRRVVGAAVDSDDLSRSDRVTLLRIRKQLKQLLAGIKQATELD